MKHFLLSLTLLLSGLMVGCGPTTSSGDNDSTNTGSGSAGGDASQSEDTESEIVVPLTPAQLFAATLSQTWIDRVKVGTNISGQDVFDIIAIASDGALSEFRGVCSLDPCTEVEVISELSAFANDLTVGDLISETETVKTYYVGVSGGIFGSDVDEVVVTVDTSTSVTSLDVGTLSDPTLYAEYESVDTFKYDTIIGTFPENAPNTALFEGNVLADKNDNGSVNNVIDFMDGTYRVYDDAFNISILTASYKVGASYTYQSTGLLQFDLLVYTYYPDYDIYLNPETLIYHELNGRLYNVEDGVLSGGYLEAYVQ